MGCSICSPTNQINQPHQPINPIGPSSSLSRIILFFLSSMQALVPFVQPAILHVEPALQKHRSIRPLFPPFTIKADVTDAVEEPIPGQAYVMRTIEGCSEGSAFPSSVPPSA
mmetsp:Transcript_19016/g.25796  ORF Transcript_19016/g.25796 Transcript_19016/m.25796 type:complete len:112 (+) Transcript_19016:144-479(+)